MATWSYQVRIRINTLKVVAAYIYEESQRLFSVYMTHSPTALFEVVGGYGWILLLDLLYVLYSDVCHALSEDIQYTHGVYTCPLTLCLPMAFPSCLIKESNEHTSV